ncbi:hypothetical protein [Pseudoxanthomonas indica]|uniref:Transmembrane repetitive protein n=1 Tax=Pseudoxanthomonas indica TaxID=428993 RepID=A0A1T5LYG9_9GAMM|nr:hypothetical protein [Pseudoxanthomonas indica]GGD42466.1 hypothetical protein GCM10007235_13080 [Pseudoxanthomonas indica]SKC81046.1 hypothetical protein SAMN06296058_3437 [Pseudoxanthomonas indica]
MTRAAELIIQALLPRKPAPVVERKTGLPYGWGLWLRALPETQGRISRDKSEAIVRDLTLRPLPARGGAIAPHLGFWSALRTLFYQQWEAPLREERGTRWLSGVVSLLMHLLFVLLLIWVAVVKLPPPPEAAGDSSRVQVEYIGRGTPAEEGGGAPDVAGQAAPRQPTAATPTAAASSEAGGDTVEAPTPITLPEFVPPSPTLSAETPQVRERSVAEPEIPPPQPVQVTETPVATQDYVLSAPNVRTDALRTPVVTPREASVQQREVVVLPTPQAPRVTRETPIQTRPVDRPIAQVQEREVSAPLPQVRATEIPSRIAPVREINAPTAAVRERAVATPNPAPAVAAAPAPAASTSPAAPAPASAATSSPAASTGTAATAAPVPNTGSGQSSTTSATPSPRGNQPGARNAGPAPADRSGGWNTPVKGDDWGASKRNVAGDSGANAGQAPGLFNADGSVRLPGTAGSGNDTSADRGAPGGDFDKWTREQIDRSGTWLQRPPYDYTPTSLDKYWVPNESLLAEWVRRNVREASIPIPGTNKKIKCVISVLQLGGGCGLVDPNLNEQPPSSRPPPEIPVKRNPIPTDS